MQAKNHQLPDSHVLLPASVPTRRRSTGWLLLAAPLLFACGPSDTLLPTEKPPIEQPPKEEPPKEEPPKTPDPLPAGTLDTTFGTQGTANIGGLSAVTEPDGGVVYVSQDTDSKTFTLTRLRADGTTVKAPAVAGDLQLADSPEIGLRYSKHQILLRQQDGKMVLVGRRDTSLVILRFNVDLSLDSGFGSGGQAIFSVASHPFGSVNSVVQQADGKLVIAGSAGNGGSLTDVALVRLLPSGQPDTSFALGGLSVIALPSDGTTSTPTRNNSAESVVVQPAGKLVVFVSGQFEANEVPRIIRLNANGNLDTGFGKDGVVFTGANYPRMNQIALEADGSILNVGADGRVLTVPLIYRVSPDGKTVQRFDYPDQFARLQNPGDTAEFTDLKVQAGGKIYTSGYIRVYVSQDGGKTYNEDASNFLARLNADLTLDKTFGTGGILRTPLVFGDRLLEQPNKMLIYNTAQTVRYWR
ncbi:hypothetical protein [Deinococcus marmoris]|uniref:Hemolysin-type calcium-binding region n=1 Tax=Deinococcus marmoris TaxID=249408 RepID=A0A1U7NVE0_9DEIO|nr:hypothetical protein [Deinococcus marmoris]OLV16893.1 Hemolysin-type calcium-binding region [Deinococcus marmoris]